MRQYSKRFEYSVRTVCWLIAVIRDEGQKWVVSKIPSKIGCILIRRNFKCFEIVLFKSFGDRFFLR